MKKNRKYLNQTFWMRLWIKYYFFASFLFRLVFLPFKFNIIKCLNKYCISVSIDVLLLFRLVDISIERGRKCENLNYSWMIISKKHKKKETRRRKFIFFKLCIFFFLVFLFMALSYSYIFLLTKWGKILAIQCWRINWTIFLRIFWQFFWFLNSMGRIWTSPCENNWNDVKFWKFGILKCSLWNFWKFFIQKWLERYFSSFIKRI